MYYRNRRHLYLPDEPSTGTGTGTGDGAASSGAGAGTGTGTGTRTPPEPQDISSLPHWAQEHIRGLRGENATARTAKNTAEAGKTAAEQESTRIREAAKVALGLGEAPTPEQLTERLNTSQVEARQAKVEVAVVRNAGTHGADPAKLTDSRSFMDTVAGLDPSASDFSTKVSDAIKAAVEQNEGLKVSTTNGQQTGQQSGQQGSTGGRRPAPDHSQGSGGSGHGQRTSSVQTGRELYKPRNKAPAGS